MSESEVIKAAETLKNYCVERIKDIVDDGNDDNEISYNIRRFLLEHEMKGDLND